MYCVDITWKIVGETLQVVSIFSKLKYTVQSSTTRLPFIVLIILDIDKSVQMLCQAAVLLQVLLLNSSTCKGFLHKIDWFMLEDVQYCQLKYNFDFEESDVLIDVDVVEGSHYTSFGKKVCFPALVIKDVDEILQFNGKCTSVNRQFIKNPNETYLFLDMKSDGNLNVEEVIEKFLCMFEDQPYFYVGTATHSMIIVQEYQLFSKRSVLVSKFVKTFDGLKVLDFVSFASRRSNFFGTTLRIHYNPLDEYNNRLGNLVAEKFNLTFDAEPIEIYGVKMRNGTFSGTIGELASFRIDVAMENFDHTPERLEIAVGGFTGIHTSSEIIYWNKAESVNIFSLVFKLELWIVLLAMLLIASIFVFIESKVHQSDQTHEKNLVHDAVVAFITTLKLFLAMEVEEELSPNQLSKRILYLTFGLLGALLVWTYSGLLVSYFSVESEAEPISSFDDLLTKQNLKLMIFDGGSSAQRFIRAIQENPSLENALKKNIFMIKNGDKMLQDFYSGERRDIVLFYQMYLVGPTVQKAHQSDPLKLCELKSNQLKEVKSKTKSGWLYPKNSMLQPIFDEFMIDLHRFGIQPRLEEKYWETIDQIKCESEYEPVGMKIMIVLFELLCIGIGLATLTFIIEILAALKVKLWTWFKLRMNLW